MPSVIRGDDNFDSANGGPNAQAGAVGTYAFLYYFGTGSTEGSTKAGSDLYMSGFHRSVAIASDGDSAVYVTQGGTAQAGTWRCMGRTNFGSANTYSRFTLWLRIA